MSEWPPREEWLSGMTLPTFWKDAGRVHDWRNHVPGHIRNIWDEFSVDHRIALKAWADDLAGMEEWD